MGDLTLGSQSSPPSGEGEDMGDLIWGSPALHLEDSWGNPNNSIHPCRN